MIWMTDLALWIIILWEAGRASQVFPLLSSVLFRCHIWVTYCSVALRWCSVSLRLVFSLSLSLFFLIICVSVALSAPWCHFFLLHSALHISFFLLSFFLVYTPTPPRAAHQGFFWRLSWLSTLRKLKSWYICYKSIVSHWARRWVQSEPHSITQISHRAGALATHRRPDSRSAGALISRTCFSCNIRAVSRSSRGGVEAGQVLAAQSHSTTEQNKTTRQFHKRQAATAGGKRQDDFHFYFFL